MRTREPLASRDEAQCNAAAEVRSFCESVSVSATRSITLLKAIEQTVDWLVWMRGIAKTNAQFADKAAQAIKICERVKVIDADGTLCALFEETEADVCRVHEMLLSKRNAGIKAPELVGHHKETIVDEYTSTIAAVADLHNMMADLRWAIGEHDADLERPSEAEFSSKEELRAYLASV